MITDEIKSKHIEEALILLRSSDVGEGKLYKIASGGFKSKIKRLHVRLINTSIHTILIGLILSLLYQWLKNL